VNWRRPQLKFVPWEGHEETNLLMNVWSCYASVNIDADRTNAPYEMFIFRDPNFTGGSTRSQACRYRQVRTNTPTVCIVTDPTTVRHGKR